MTPPVPPGWKCPKRVGFLFPHACTRLTPEGCPDCQGGHVRDPYLGRSRYGYTDYDSYDDSMTGFALGSLMEHREHSMQDQFTEADGESLVTPQDAFEDDLSGS
jgi:hypothetical protein